MSMKHVLSWGLALPALLVWGASAASAQTVTNFTFEQLDFLNADGVVVADNSDWGQVSFDIVPVGDGVVRYLNIYAETGDVCTENGWIVRNYPVLPSEFIDPGRFSLHFDFNVMCVPSETNVTGADVQYIAEVGTIIETNPPIGPLVKSQFGGVQIARFGGLPPGGTHGYEGPPALSPPYYTQDVDKTKLQKYKGIPGVQEGDDECASGSAARSLKWLSNNHGLGLGTVDAIQDELAKAKYMDQGATAEQMADAKNKYIKDNKLPLEVHYWYSKTTYPAGVNTPGIPSENNTDIDLIDWLWREMRKGQDIEIFIHWDQSTEGHYVTLVGIDKKNKKIEYRDDEKQGDDSKGDDAIKEAKMVALGNGEYGWEAAADRIIGAFAESPKPDPHVTVPGSEPDGTEMAIGGGEMPQIPADFFGPGSDPFVGTVLLDGDAIDPDTLADTSTLLWRSGTPVLPGDPNGTEGTVDVELIDLNLVSIEPIVVTFNGGQDPEQWDVRVTLSSTLAPQGTLTATKTHQNGGVFAQTFFVQPKFTFTRISDNTQAVLDTGLEGEPPIEFHAFDVPFVHALDVSVDILAPWDGSFVPGVDEVNPGDPASQVTVMMITESLLGDLRHSVIPTPLDLCPLVFETPLDPCFDRRQECVGPADLTCWPSKWTSENLVTKCACLADSPFSGCGALDVSEFPILQCVAGCADTGDPCQIEIDGVGTGQSWIDGSAVPPDAEVTCGCSEGAGIPTVSEWGMIVLTVLLLTAGAVAVGRRRRPAAA